MPNSWYNSSAEVHNKTEWGAIFNSANHSQSNSFGTWILSKDRPFCRGIAPTVVDLSNLQQAEGAFFVMVKSNCKFCHKEIIRPGTKPGIFCNLNCKGQWQQTQKPVDKEWLYQKYIVEGLGTYEIGKLVERDPKRVYEWLIGYGIPTRTQHDSIVSLNKRGDTRKKRSKKAKGRILTPAQKQKLSKARTGKHYPNLQGANNGMFGRKGELHPNWLGGLTPERQALYSSQEWKQASEIVWKRDKGTCQRCGKKYRRKATSFHIHHIKSFSLYIELRTEPGNLVLLCSDCHHWVHSNQNTNKEFING